MWREERIQGLLSTEDADVLFLSGCAQNMGKFLPQFDQVVLLSAPADVIVERLGSRINSQYGKHPDEVARVLGLRETVEPLLRGVAGHEIDTSVGLEDVVASVLRLVPHMVSEHLNRHLTQPQREQFVRLLQSAADDAGLPTDPEFRSAFAPI